MVGGTALLGGGAAVFAYAVWWRRNPSPCPYQQRFFLEVPHPFLTRARLRRILAPQPGERVLEVGPGTGYYTLDIAQQIAPDGVLDILDLQQEMLDHTMRKASERHITNIVPVFLPPSPLRIREEVFSDSRNSSRPLPRLYHGGVLC